MNNQVTYTFVELTENEDITLEEVKKFINEIEFIVTNYNTMYHKDKVTIQHGHRGYMLRDKVTYNHDWLYNIIGGYKIDK